MLEPPRIQRFIGFDPQARVKNLSRPIAILLLESIFGLHGLIMAPLTYAYIKHELTEEGLV